MYNRPPPRATRINAVHRNAFTLRLASPNAVVIGDRAAGGYRSIASRPLLLACHKLNDMQPEVVRKMDVRCIIVNLQTACMEGNFNE